MPTYLVSYHGGSAPDSPEAAAMMLAAFQAWASGVGDKMIDPGAPLGAARAVTAEGAEPAEGTGPGGYTLLRADDMDAAVALVADHPFVARGGTLIVSEAMAL